MTKKLEEDEAKERNSVKQVLNMMCEEKVYRSFALLVCRQLYSMLSKSVFCERSQLKQEEDSGALCTGMGWFW